MKLRLRRPLSLLLAAVMVLGLLPTAAFAAENDGLCEHHLEHTAECGYTEAVEGSPCTHQDDEACGYTLGTEEVPCDKDCTDDDGDGIIDHAEDCSYQPAVEGSLFTHVHDEECGYVEAVEGQPCQYVCQLCAAPSDGEGQPPADNSDPTPQDNSNSQITSLVLKDFTPFGETTASDYDLLQENNLPVQWDVESSYTLEIGLKLTPGVEDTMTLTLPYGMRFVNLNPNNLEIDGVDSVEWKKSDKIYNSYQRDNGTLTVEFSNDTETITLTVVVQPDLSFFPPEKKSEGFRIEDAIQVELNDGSGENAQATVAVNVRTDMVVVNPGITDIPQNKVNVVPDQTISLSANFSLGSLASNYRFVESMTATISVPDGLTFSPTDQNITVENKGADSDDSGRILWSFSVSQLHRPSYPFSGVQISIPQDATPGTGYTIQLKSASATAYGQNAAWEIDHNNRVLWTITVVDPKDIKLELTPGDALKVYDFTKALEDSGNSFSDYHTSFAGATLKNLGATAADADLVYYAEFDQNVQFVTAVGIPCGWDDKSDEWLPTKIIIITDKGKTYTLSANGSDYKAIRAVASLPYDGKGFILRASNIPGFDTTESIASVTVELPGLPQNYQSSDYPLVEAVSSWDSTSGNRNGGYTGVWGRVRDSRGEEKQGTNQFYIWKADTGSKDDLLAQTESTTTIVEDGAINIPGLTPTLTVDGKNGQSIVAGDSIHISTLISPSNGHGGFHGAETVLYNPVIYLLQPKDLHIENETFKVTGSEQEITYSRELVQANDLPNGYTLYEYTLNETLFLGWWDGDWESSFLSLEFDYKASRSAQTKVYDLSELILFKSSLEFTFNGVWAEDTYDLNNGKRLGKVYQTKFNVQASPDLQIGADIQIEGEKDWYTYDPEAPANSTAVFREGDTANVRVTVSNNSNEDISEVEVYIPVPKKDGVDLGASFISEAGFDMFVTGTADTTKAPDWTVQYGQVKKVKYEDGVVKDIILQEKTDWEEKASDSTNMIKLTLSSDCTMKNGTAVEIILHFKATTNTSQTDSTNIFKSWWKYRGNQSAMVDAENVYNFGALLQNGKLTGTVFADDDRDGIKDDNEKGVSGVQIVVTDEDGRTYYATTNENGQYAFDSLPGNKEMTVTVTNPKSGQPNGPGGSYRFSPSGQASAGQIGSDVTANEAGTQATAKLENLGDSGAATVNAGLITPYTIHFSAGEHGSVSVSSVKAYGNQTLGDVLNSAPTVTPASGHTHTGWYPDGKTELLTNAQLLTQTVTGDTTYTAQYKSVTYSVTVNGSHASTTGAGDYQEGATVTIQAGTNSGYTFTGWTVTPSSVTLTNASTTTTFTMPAENVTVTANWQKDEPTPAGTITVTPADIIIYMGGKPYEGAVDENGNIISNENAGLPEPGFTVQLPAALNGMDVTSLAFQEKDGDRKWTFQPYDGQTGTTVYKLVPAEGQEATRVQFTDPDTGKVIPSDEFIVGLEVNKDFEMELYRGSGDSQVGAIEVEVDGGTKYAVTTESGTLTVRGTTEDVSINPVSSDAPTSGAGAVAQSGTTYTINGGDVQVTDTSGVSLLFDGIINNSGNDRTGQLQSRAESYFQEKNISPSSGNRFAYEFKYLDLVDANNGNA